MLGAYDQANIHLAESTSFTGRPTTEKEGLVEAAVSGAVDTKAATLAAKIVSAYFQTRRSMPEGCARLGKRPKASAAAKEKLGQAPEASPSRKRGLSRD
jgi:hypothetical protein